MMKLTVLFYTIIFGTCSLMQTSILHCKNLSSHFFLYPATNGKDTLELQEHHLIDAYKDWIFWGFSFLEEVDGWHSSELFSKDIYDDLQKNFDEEPIKSKDVLKKVCEEMKQKIQNHFYPDTKNSACASLLILYKNKTITIANVGSLHAFVFRNNNTANLIPLAKTHVPWRKEEIDRFNSNTNLLIEKDGKKLIGGILPVSRTFGYPNTLLKSVIPSDSVSTLQSLLMPEPYITSYVPNKNDTYLLLTTDNVLDIISEDMIRGACAEYDSGTDICDVLKKEIIKKSYRKMSSALGVVVIDIKELGDNFDFEMLFDLMYDDFLTNINTIKFFPNEELQKILDFLDSLHFILLQSQKSSKWAEIHAHKLFEILNKSYSLIKVIKKITKNTLTKKNISLYKNILTLFVNKKHRAYEFYTEEQKITLHQHFKALYG